MLARILKPIFFLSVFFLPSIAVAETKLYFSHEKAFFSDPSPAIERVDADGTDRTSILALADASSPFGVEVHQSTGKMYWTQADNKIRRSNLDGTSIEDLVTSGLDAPKDIALDRASGKMYWTEYNSDIIKRANLDGSNVESLTGSFASPIYLALDLTNNKLYYTEYQAGLLRRCDLDGSNKETILSGLNFPTGIALDVPAGKLYWGENAGTKIGRANLNGTSTETIKSGGSMWGLRKDPLQNVLYYMQGHIVRKINTDGTGDVALTTASAFGRQIAVLGDFDNDTVLDDLDNCPSASNASQLDTNTDGEGDACDTDDDGDGVVDGSDNCSLISNASQLDTDTDGSGNSCDTDDDGDGVVDGSDNCSLISNASQLDTDTDGSGDSCDTDDDGDGVVDGSDNCSLISNASQLDTDTDGSGNSCDTDDDGDTVLDGSDNCSLVSNASQLDTDTDGNGNACDTDDDGDGVEDSVESSLGSDPLDSDSDDDGVLDGQEITDGTNPIDSGSTLVELQATLCAEWNGFFNGGMWNILEHVNSSGTAKAVQSNLYDSNGTLKSTIDFAVSAGGQTDLLVHGMTGRINQSYGKVCSTIGGSAGDLDGRMVYYFPVGNSYDFAFAMPFLNGLTGRQSVSFNTFQPSSNPADSNNLVANWIQLTNLENSSQTGTLFYYGQDGSTLASEVVNVPSGARRDFSGHQFGRNLVGSMEWTPDSNSAKFQLRNVRYYYNNPGQTDRFDSAVQIGAAKGSGENLAAPLDASFGSAILEIANTRNAATDVNVQFFDSAGTSVSSPSLSIPAKGSIHLIADSLLPSTFGSALVKATSAGGVVVNAMHYGRASSGSLNFVFEASGLQSLGTVMRGSYNTYLNQECDLYLINTAASARDVTITLTREDGTVVLNAEAHQLPGHGTLRYALCSRDIDDTYGVVTVQPTTANSIAAYVIRKGPNDAYRFSTPVRQ